MIEQRAAILFTPLCFAETAHFCAQKDKILHPIAAGGVERDVY